MHFPRMLRYAPIWTFLCLWSLNLTFLKSRPFDTIPQTINLALNEFRFFPVAKTVHCKKGATYQITSGADLRDYFSELECIFDVGIPPSGTPKGMWYGGVLSVLTTRLHNAVSEQIWQGKVASSSQCRGSDTEFTFIQNFIFGDLGYPAYVYLGTLKDPVQHTERDDGQESLIVDYTIDWQGLCPTSQEGDTNSSPATLNLSYPLSSIVDLARVVGFTEDGGQILLGKTFVRDLSNFPSSKYVIRLHMPWSVTLPCTEKLESVLLCSCRDFNVAWWPQGIPVTDTESGLYKFLDEWPLAGNPRKDGNFELIKTEPDVGPFPKSGRRPSVPNTMGTPAFSDYMNNIYAKLQGFEQRNATDSDSSEYFQHSELLGRPGSGVTDIANAALINLMPEAENFSTITDAFKPSDEIPILSEATQQLKKVGNYANYLPENALKVVSDIAYVQVGNEMKNGAGEHVKNSGESIRRYNSTALSNYNFTASAHDLATIWLRFGAVRDIMKPVISSKGGEYASGIGGEKFLR